MIRLPSFVIPLLIATASASAGALAQDPAACAPGEDCAEATRWGAWGLILLGALFFAVGFLPARPRSEDEPERTGLPMFRMLHQRIEKETTGWRRWQWPALGIFFILVGIAFLAGWR